MTPVRELSELGAAIRERLGARGPAGAPVTLAVAGGLAALAAVQFLGVAQPVVQACCVESARLPWALALVRLPGSTMAPAQSLPVAGALLQVIVVAGSVELLLGSRVLLSVGLAAQLASTVAARVMFTAGLAPPLGLDPAAAGERDTGPSVVVLAVAVYALARLRLRYLLALTSLAVLAQVAALPTLAGREHLVALVCGLVAAWLHRNVTTGQPPAGARRGRVRWALVAAGTLLAVAGLDGASMAATRGAIVASRPGRGPRPGSVAYGALVLTPAQLADPGVVALLRAAPLSPAVDPSGSGPAPVRSGPSPPHLLAFDPGTAPRGAWAVGAAGSALRAGLQLRRRYGPAASAGSGKRGPGCTSVLTLRRPASSTLLLGRLRHVRFVLAERRTLGGARPGPLAAAGQAVVLDARSLSPDRLGWWVDRALRAARSAGLRIRPVADLLPDSC